MSNISPDTFQLDTQVRFREVDKEGVLVHLVSGLVIIVNEVGLHIVAAITEPRTNEELVLTVSEHFNVDKTQAATDVAIFLTALNTENLLIKTSEQGS